LGGTATGPAEGPHHDPAWAAYALAYTAAGSIREIPVHMWGGGCWSNIGMPEREAHARLLRCLFGNPFRPVSISLARLTPTVKNLAQAAYDNRILPAGALEPARLAVLADALEDAGCTDADLLGHLRGEGPHVRGCWAVDLLTGRI
jgi:hypothetical protein